MTLLASRLADRIGARLLTPLPEAERLALAARLDARLEGAIPSVMYGQRHWREYAAWGRRRNSLSGLATGMISQLAIEKVAVDPDTPVDKILDFKKKHPDELARFRIEIENLASKVDPADLPIEALRQQVLDSYKHDVAPALANLKKALRSGRIKWFAQGLLKIVFMSAGSSSMLVAAAGLSIPTALLAGAGISLVIYGVTYNQDKRESLTNNPYAYLLALEQNLK